MTTSSAPSFAATLAGASDPAAGALDRAARARARLAAALLRTRYQLQQAGLFLSGAVGVRLWHLLMAPWARLPAAEQLTWQQRFRDLLERDLRNVEAGYYPGELLLR